MPSRVAGVIAGLLSLVATASLGAQTIRGTVVDEASKLPIPQVIITLLDATGTEIQPGVRSDTLGNFTIHASRAGTWRVKGLRLGYSPVTSDPVQLSIGSLAVVRLRLTPVAQELVPVRVVERRQLNANELMSTMGFDLRESRGLGHFLGGQRLAAMGEDGVGEILAKYFQPTIYVSNDPVLGDVILMRKGMGSCPPEIFLDGRLLAKAPESATFTGIPPTNAIDSARAQTAADGERFRAAAGQMHALSLLSSFRASQIYGIEVYRANEVPPPSLGAWFGMSKTAIRSCGTVAVWTKAGARSIATARTASASGRAIQVVTGTLVDFETGAPLAGRTVTLLTEGRDRIGSPVVTDERGDFTLRTSRAGELRLTSGGKDYLTSTTPPFSISPDEMVVVKMYVSAREGVLAPLGVAARVLPQNIGLTSRSGFAYRRERAQGGTFFTTRDIEGSGVVSLADLIARARGATTCSPVFYLDGAQLTDSAQAKVAALSLDRVFGVEVYTKQSETPSVFSDAGGCGAVVIWTKP